MKSEATTVLLPSPVESGNFIIYRIDLFEKVVVMDSI